MNRGLHLGESLVLGRKHDRFVLFIRVLITRRRAFQEAICKVLTSARSLQSSHLIQPESTFYVTSSPLQNLHQPFP